MYAGGFAVPQKAEETLSLSHYHYMKKKFRSSISLDVEKNIIRNK